jgi:hypothetical protein
MTHKTSILCLAVHDGIVRAIVVAEPQRYAALMTPSGLELFEKPKDWNRLVELTRIERATS